MLVFDLLNVGNITNLSPLPIGIQYTPKVENPPTLEGAIIPKTVFEGKTTKRDPYLEEYVLFVLKYILTD